MPTNAERVAKAPKARVSRQQRKHARGEIVSFRLPVWLRLDPANILDLQQVVGNRVVQRLIDGTTRSHPLPTKHVGGAAPTSVKAITSDLSNPQIKELADALDELTELVRIPGGPKNRPKFRENRARDRDLIVQKVAEVRTLIRSLSTADLGVDLATLKQARAYYYRRLNALTSYYTQRANIDLLYRETKSGKKKEAWTRTCNVTSIAMALEGLGVTTRDFKGSDERMELIAAHYRIEDIFELRLPDFLQLVAIYKCLGKVDPADLSPDVLRKKIAAARAAAVEMTTKSDNFNQLTSLFGVKANPIKANTIKAKLSRSLTQLGKLHAPVTRAEKAVTRQKRKLKKQIELLGKPGIKDQRRRRIQKRIDDLQEKLEEKQQELQRQQELEKVRDKQSGLAAAVPLGFYRVRMLQALGNELQSGKQIIANRPSHFVRLQSVSDTGIVVDDPMAGKNLPITWEKARAQGFFRRYIILAR